MAKGIGIAAVCFVREMVANERIELAFDVGNEELAIEITKEQAERIAWLSSAIEQRLKETSPRELTRIVTGFVTEAYLTHKSLGAAHKFCEASKIKALELAEKIKAGEQVAVTAEGIQVRIASKASETLSKMEQTGEKLKRLPARVTTDVSSGIDLVDTRKLVKKLVDKGVIPKETGQEIMRQLNLPRCDAHGLVTKRGFHKWIPPEIQDLVISNETIEKLCKPYGTNIGYEHVFAPELMYNCEKNILEGAGWHHDHLGRVLKSGKVQIKNLVEGPHGTYKAWWSYGGSEFKESTFFPSAWSEAEVLSKINEAMTNATEIMEAGKGRFSITGFTSEGIKITSIVEASSMESLNNIKKIITAYPGSD